MKYFVLYIFLCTSLFVQSQVATNINILNSNIMIKTFPTGIYGSNCYVISQNNIGFIVDAGSNDTAIMQYVEANNITVKYIFCTHSHIDHVLFAMDLKACTGAKIVIHTEDKNHYKYYTQERINAWIKSGEVTEEQMPLIEKFINIQYDTLLSGGEVFSIGEIKIEILYTPGHSKGSFCLLVNGRYLFTGDTIFDNSIGNTDIDTGNYDDIVKSIKELILPLKDTIIVYQGHGNVSTMKDIRKKLYIN